MIEALRALQRDVTFSSKYKNITVTKEMSPSKIKNFIQNDLPALGGLFNKKRQTNIYQSLSAVLK